MKQSLLRLKTPAFIMLTMALIALALVAAPRRASAANTSIFGRERLFTLNADDTAAIKSSYNTVILFVVDVAANGDLNYNGNHPIIQNGTWIGDPGWGGRLAALKQAPTTVNRIEVCTGGAGAQSFVNIRNLINSQGTGSGSILYRNFQVLKNMLGVDAINYDDEVDYNAGAAVAFGNMLGSLGMHVTLCPYNNQSYWQTIKSQLGNNCDAVYLQCYDGGGGNNPSDWNNLFGGFKVQPGDWDADSAATVQAKMSGWRTSAGVTGGFIWLLDDMSADSARQYSLAVNNGIGGSGPMTPYFMLVNQNSGKCLDLISGNTANGAVINQWAYDGSGPNQRWALLPTENGDHFKLISWISGKCACPAGDSMNNGAQIHDWDYTGNNSAQQWDLVDAGNGWYNIKNVHSGLLLEVYMSSTVDNATVDQYANTNSATQRWRLQPWGGYYARTAAGKYVCIQGSGSANGSSIVQFDWQANPWFQWSFTSEGDGFYGLFSLNAPGRVLCVQDGSYAAGYNTHLWDYNPSNYGDQKIRILPKTNGKYKFYFKHDNMSWDIPGGSTANFAPLQQYPDNGNAQQDYSLERTP